MTNRKLIVACNKEYGRKVKCSAAVSPPVELVKMKSLEVIEDRLKALKASRGRFRYEMMAPPLERRYPSLGRSVCIEYIKELNPIIEELEWVLNKLEWVLNI